MYNSTFFNIKYSTYTSCTSSFFFSCPFNYLERTFTNIVNKIKEPKLSCHYCISSHLQQVQKVAIFLNVSNILTTKQIADQIPILTNLRSRNSVAFIGACKRRSLPSLGIECIVKPLEINPIRTKQRGHILLKFVGSCWQKSDMQTPPSLVKLQKGCKSELGEFFYFLIMHASHQCSSIMVSLSESKLYSSFTLILVDICNCAT